MSSYCRQFRCWIPFFVLFLFLFLVTRKIILVVAFGFAPKFWQGSEDLQMMFCKSVNPTIGWQLSLCFGGYHFHVMWNSFSNWSRIFIVFFTCVVLLLFMTLTSMWMPRKECNYVNWWFIGGKDINQFPVSCRDNHILQRKDYSQFVPPCVGTMSDNWWLIPNRKEAINVTITRNALWEHEM